MKISVIIPYKEEGALLDRCLESVKRSIAKNPFDECEIIAVHGPAGVSQARNDGLKRVTGDYIAWVDSDDEVTEDWFLEICKALKEGVDVVVFGALVSGGGRTAALSFTDEDTVCDARKFLSYTLRDIRSSAWLWNKVFKRDLFEGLSFKGRTQEDFRIMPFVLMRASTVKSLKKVLYTYYRPEGSLSRHSNIDASVEGLRLAIEETLPSLPAEIRPDWIEGVVIRIADFLRNGADNGELRRFLRRHVWRVFVDFRQSFRIKVKCLIEAVKIL